MARPSPNLPGVSRRTTAIVDMHCDGESEEDHQKCGGAARSQIAPQRLAQADFELPRCLPCRDKWFRACQPITSRAAMELTKPIPIFQLKPRRFNDRLHGMADHTGVAVGDLGRLDHS